MERLSIAQYFCELCGILAPREEPADAMLRLMLLGLHHLNGDIYPPLLVKCVVEQRMLLLGGYAPDLSGCARCGRTEAESFRLSPAEGNLLCADCAAKTDGLPALCRDACGAAAHSHVAGRARISLPAARADARGARRGQRADFCSISSAAAFVHWIFTTHCRASDCDALPAYIKGEHYGSRYDRTGAGQGARAAREKRPAVRMPHSWPVSLSPFPTAKRPSACSTRPTPPAA